MIVLPFLATVFLTSPCRAEYRVFLLKISKAPAAAAETNGPPADPKPASTSPSNPGSGEVRFVESNLDPFQYPTYHPLAPDETITYVDTWRCPGRTQGRPFCPNPRNASAQGPESTRAPAAVQP